MTFDLTIKGAGIFGLSIAWEATRRGAKVQVVDPHGPGSGASGGVVGALQPHAPDRWSAKKQFQFESLMMAAAFWQDVEATSGISSGYGLVGRIQPLANERGIALAKERSVAAAEQWGDVATWEVTRNVGLWAPTSPTGFYLRDTLSAILNPRRAVESLASALTTLSVPIVTEAPDQGAVLWATGAQGLRDLSEAMGQDAGAGEKGQAALLAHDASGQPQVYVDGLHIIPHLDGTTAVGSTSERYFESTDSTDAQLDDIIERAHLAMPILKSAKTITRWAGLRPRTASRAPLLGAWPGRDGHFVANGGFKIGFGMAPKIAGVMCDLILEDRNTIPDDFSFRALGS